MTSLSITVAEIAFANKPSLPFITATGIAAAFVGRHFLTVRACTLVMPHIRGAWLDEFGEDIVGVTLVRTLQNYSVALDPVAATAGQRGWKTIEAAAAADKELRS